MIPASEYYGEYYGHTVEHLKAAVSALRAAGHKRFVWLVGDSTLDNKHWLFDQGGGPSSMNDARSCAPALNGYERVLTPPRMVRDVCYWINKSLHDARQERSGAGEPEPPMLCCVNTAVEESTLGERSGAAGRLTAQDEFVSEVISEGDVLIVNAGGNDVALKPTKATAVYMALLLYLSCTCVIRSFSCAIELCCGCHIGFPLGLSHFVRMFKTDTKEFIEKLVRRKKPRKVIVCMLYYLDESPAGGWADGVLKMLGYDSNPAKLQAVIKRIFELSTTRIRIEGTEVIPFPLFEVLDGKNANDYVQRVEPSVEGGRKMAEALTPFIISEL